CYRSSGTARKKPWRGRASTAAISAGCCPSPTSNPSGAAYTAKPPAPLRTSPWLILEYLRSMLPNSRSARSQAPAQVLLSPTHHTKPLFNSINANFAICHSPFMLRRMGETRRTAGPHAMRLAIDGGASRIVAVRLAADGHIAGLQDEQGGAARVALDVRCEQGIAVHDGCKPLACACLT